MCDKNKTRPTRTIKAMQKKKKKRNMDQNKTLEVRVHLNRYCHKVIARSSQTRWSFKSADSRSYLNPRNSRNERKWGGNKRKKPAQKSS